MCLTSQENLKNNKLFAVHYYFLKVFYVPIELNLFWLDNLFSIYVYAWNTTAYVWFQKLGVGTNSI